MKILELEIQGFRSLKKITWKPGDLNVVIGRNGSGKSNLLRALELISASAQGNLDNFTVKSGGTDDLVWDGSATNIRFSLRTSPMVGGRIGYDNFKYEVGLTKFNNKNDFRIEDELLSKPYLYEQREKAQPFKLLERSAASGNAAIFNETGGRLTSPGETISPKETLLASTTAPAPFVDKQYAEEYRQASTFGKELGDWTIYHDIRTDRDAEMRKEAVSSYDRHVATDGQNLINVLHTLYDNVEDRTFRDQINSAMRAAFGNDFEGLIFPPGQNQRVQLRLLWKTLRRAQPATNLSDGTLRFLFLLTVLLNPSLPSLVAIDEPETGLHPAMLAIIAETATNASKRTQLVLTTHSDQFLNFFSPVKTQPTVTVAKWSEGETKFQVLDADRLRYWLEDYSLGKLFVGGQLENMAQDELEDAE